MTELELESKLLEIRIKVERARSVLSCLSNDLFDGAEPSGAYTALYAHYQDLSCVVNDYLFEAEKAIRELREGE